MTVYDNLGRLTYSIANYVSGSSDPSANLTTLSAYDAAGDKVASVDPAGADTRTFFNVEGGVASSIANCTDATPGAQPGAGWASCAGTGAPGEKSWNVVSTALDTASQSDSTTTTTSVAGTITTTTTYDGAGRVLKAIVDPAGAHPLETDYAYDLAGRQVAVKSPAGVVTITTYDLQGRTISTIANCTDSDPGVLPTTNWASCSGAGAQDGTWNQVSSTAYDDAGNKISSTAANGTITKYSYDNNGNLTSEVDNWVPSISGPTMNVTTSYYYDSNGRRIATALPIYGAIGAYSVTFDSYDSSGRLASEIVNCTSTGTTPDANPAACTGLGTKNSQTNITTSYGYDLNGNKISMSAPSPANGAAGTDSVITRYAYDADNRLCRVLENATVDMPLTDPCHTDVSGTVPQNVSTKYDYYPTGLLWHEYDPAPAGTTTYGYDGQGHLTSQTDADGNTTTWTYDANGNKTSETDPDTAPNVGPTISYAYDSAGRQCRRVAANPGVILQSLTNPCTDAAPGSTVDTRYTYDNAGNVLTATDAIGTSTITSTYDQLNRPLTVSGDQSGDPATIYTYDFVNPTRTDPSGSYTGTLDAYGREIGLTDPLHTTGNMYAWTYAATGAVATNSDPTGNVTTNSYDPLGRLTARSTTGGSGCTNCAVYSFAYNNAGNELTKTSTISGDAANGPTTYSYDALSRLTGYTPPTVIAPQTYTWNGQPDRASIKTGTGTQVNVTFDAASRPVSDSAGNTYSSDKEGHITGIPGKTLAYDALGRLTQVKAAPGGTVLANYTYDALDRLRTINVGSATNRFRYVGQTTSMAQIFDNVGLAVLWNRATDLNGTELYDFTPGGSTQTYLGRNDHGDVTWTASTTGAVTARASYDPYGNLVSSSGSTPYSRWQGSYFDGSSGLYYVNARWYSSTLSTFLSDDPLTQDPADPQSRDPYAYGSGDPVDLRDPSGLKGCDGGYNHGLCDLTYFNNFFPDFYNQNWSPWGREPMVTLSRQLKTKAANKTPCKDTIAKVGCLLTSLAMVLDYLDLPIDVYDANGSPSRLLGMQLQQLPDPLKLDYWFNAQTSNNGRTDANLLGATSCEINPLGGAMGGRLKISVKQIKPRTVPYAWYQATGKGNALNAIAGYLRAGNAVIAEVPGAPTHFVVITGWVTWGFSGKSQWNKSREFGSQKKVGSHYEGTKGDFIMSDPENPGPGGFLFSKYNHIMNLYGVKPL